jgi:hypothetical protein
VKLVWMIGFSARTVAAAAQAKAHIAGSRRRIVRRTGSLREAGMGVN